MAPISQCPRRDGVAPARAMDRLYFPRRGGLLGGLSEREADREKEREREREGERGERADSVL